MNERLIEMINVREYYNLIIGYLQGLGVKISSQNNVRYIFFNNINKFLNSLLENDDGTCNLSGLLDIFRYLYNNIQTYSNEFRENRINKSELEAELTSQVQNFINKYYEII